MNKLEILECRLRNIRPRGTINIFIESWRDVKRLKKHIEKCGTLDIYNRNYWAMTDKITIDLEIGEIRKSKKMKDRELMSKYEVKYELRKEYQIIFTDSSK